jgi:hypothetical protein
MSNNTYDLYKKRYVLKFIDADPKSPTDKVKTPEHKSKGRRNAKRPKKVKDIPKKDEDLTCAICIDEICNKSYKLECGHIFHKECLKGLIKKECPLCRRLLKKLPDDISESIEKNIESYRVERQEEIANEDLLTIIADDNLMRTMILIYSFMRDMGSQIS